jgi:colanic acid/amylovoran/stewartan biosynthesis glycosyltransferase WcaL/AmsK/CpsK
MTAPLRVAVFVGTFPVVSETFIVRQIAGLLDSGQEVDIFADCRAEKGTPVDRAVQEHGLMSRATFMDLPRETVPYEMPVLPLLGRTWPPGATEPISNWRRIGRALPVFLDCLTETRGLALSVVRPSNYGYRARSLSCLWRLARLLTRRERGYDVLHAHFGPVGESYRFARELFQAPLVVSFHGYDFAKVPRQEGPQVYGRLFEASDAITVNSEYTAGKVRELGGPPSRMHKLPMGLPLESIPFRARTRRNGQPLRLLTVARLVPIKGHEFALRAVAQLDATHGPVEYHLVGDGPERESLERLAVELSVASRIHFHGACAGSELARHYAESHLFVLPSVSLDGAAEGQGLVLQEAQAAGLPVVTTDQGGLPEGVVAGRAGLIVPERDAEALARALATLADHPEQWESMGRAGRAWAEANYDQRKLTGRLLEIYERARETYARRNGVALPAPKRFGRAMENRMTRTLI